MDTSRSVIIGRARRLWVGRLASRQKSPVVHPPRRPRSQIVIIYAAAQFIASSFQPPLSTLQDFTEVLQIFFTF